MSEFQREHRYCVLKLSDMNKYLSPTQKGSILALAEKMGAGRALDGKQQLECVVVERDWPEFEAVWAMIEARMCQSELLVEVGDNHKRSVSKINRDMFKLAEQTMIDENNAAVNGCHHIGWADVGDFIDALESKYNITPKGE